MRHARTTAALAAAFIAALALAPGDARAQVVPDRLYYGVNRPVPVEIKRPDNAAPDADLSLAAYDAAGERVVMESAVSEGPADLFEIFPVLWNRSRPQPLYLQLRAAGEPVGAPLFLDPLRPPVTASLEPGSREVTWDDSKRRPYTGLRIYPARFLVFETSEGDMTWKLRPDVAPNTAKHILDLVEGGFYTDIVVHRIIPANANGDPFVIQFGDPQGFGIGGPGFYADLERSDLNHAFGVVSMARGRDPNSNGSQVFVCLSRAATIHLDDGYTAVAEIVEGADTVLALENVPLDDERRGVPSDPKPVVESARSIPAPPITQWPHRIERPAPSNQSR